uniref:Uncharacterized protein n=1 Tax=uncultured marine virus TaxID=186617 RepID=A0A0F7L5Q4_9VIRU|nr:hypothetical protein [uncultured marine virus]
MYSSTISLEVVETFRQGNSSSVISVWRFTKTRLEVVLKPVTTLTTASRICSLT